MRLSPSLVCKMNLSFCANNKTDLPSGGPEERGVRRGGGVDLFTYSTHPTLQPIPFKRYLKRNRFCCTCETASEPMGGEISQSVALPLHLVFFLPFSGATQPAPQKLAAKKVSYLNVYVLPSSFLFFFFFLLLPLQLSTFSSINPTHSKPTANPTQPNPITF